MMEHAQTFDLGCCCSCHDSDCWLDMKKPTAHEHSDLDVAPVAAVVESSGHREHKVLDLNA